MNTLWMVRAGRGSEHIDAFLEHGVVAIGWPDLGDLSKTPNKDDLSRLYAARYPGDRDGKRIGAVSQILRFVTELHVGDRVVTFDRDRRVYILGDVTSDYQWQPELVAALPHTRRVKWTREVPRDALSTSTRNTLGAIQTLFKISADGAKDLEKHARPLGETSPEAPKPVPRAEPEDTEALATLVTETIEKADEFVEDAISALDWDELQSLVAGILRAMGYRTTVSEPGPDGGVDIFASPDGLGLEEPRIFVEVKHRGAQMGAQAVRAFLGGRKPGDRCLYVSTGGFSKDAVYEARRAAIPINLITLPKLRALLLEYYDKVDGETRALVPLRRLYWPESRK